LFDSAEIEDGVFIGPGVILTNDRYPRAINGNMLLKTALDWKKVGVSVSKGASIGAGSICVAPIAIGEWALIGAGSVVTRDVASFALVVGNPAKQIGWVGPEGYKLIFVSDGLYECPKSKAKFRLMNGKLEYLGIE
jgi:acetyltransferase-like isoleucine patch superfamily enzyme